MSRFYCFMLLLLMMSPYDASRLNDPSEKLKVKKILSSTNKKPVKSIKSLDGDIIDCVLFSHQPAFDHPLLKNQTIQMRPSDYPEGLFVEGKDDITKPITQLWHLNGRCPEGTVPIRRTKKEDIMRASSIDSFGKKHKSFSHPPSADALLAASPTHEYFCSFGWNTFLPFDFSNISRSSIPNRRPRTAVKFLLRTTKISDREMYAYATVERNAYYGAKATIKVWNPQIQDSKEFSLSQFWIVGGPRSSLNTIEAGWIVYPYLLGDNNTRLFIYWTSDGYQSTGCYNLLCSGFVQTNNNLALGGSINPFSTYQGAQIEIAILVWKDPKQDLWWLKYGNEVLGYWPASLFQYLSNSAELIQWGGEITNYKVDGQHTATRMGSGHFAEEGYKGASYFRNLQVVDNSNTLRSPSAIRVIARQPTSYNNKTGNSNDWGDYFFYGGPGRNPNCP